MATEPSSKSNSDKPFSVDIDDYDDADVVVFGTVMHKLGKFKDAAEEIFQPRGSLSRFLNGVLNGKLGISTATPWNEPGTDCEILKSSGKGWKKGRIKFEITVKFYPDEPEVEEIPTSNEQEVNQAEPSLDDIRLTMDKLS